MITNEAGQREKMKAGLECVLFVAGDPVSLYDLARAINSALPETEAALRDLQFSLAERGSGLQLIQIAEGWQLATRPEYGEVLGSWKMRGAGKLSRPALETLAIVAYRQPVTAPEIEMIRGVAAGGVLKTLQERNLIAEAGRKMAPGRPVLYVTTPDFLHYFALADLNDLPPLDEESALPVVPAALTADGAHLPEEVEKDGREE